MVFAAMKTCSLPTNKAGTWLGTRAGKWASLLLSDMTSVRCGINHNCWQPLMSGSDLFIIGDKLEQVTAVKSSN
jgi:hypothetical protein